MADNSYKTPFGRTINQLAEAKALQAIQQLGKALPCSVVAVSGSIVTVKFEMNSPYTLPNVTMPMFGPEYIRYPIKAGDKGVTLPADAYLGGMSGLGGGVAGVTLPTNLSALVFLPISNQAWFAVDPNAVTIYGPNGVVLQDTTARSSLILTPTGIAMIGETTVTITVGASEIEMLPAAVNVTTVLTTFNSNVVIDGDLVVTGLSTGMGGGDFNVTTLVATGDVTAGTSTTPVTMLAHLHPGVQPGGGNTGPAIP